MSKLNKYIEQINENGEKVLSVFLTAGYPNKEDFVRFASDVLIAGADILELGIPFSDPQADGPTIQESSYQALKNGVTVSDTLQFAQSIRKRVDKPIVIMTYANPILAYGPRKFFEEAVKVGVAGVIIPDLVIDEVENFIPLGIELPDLIFLGTPTTKPDRMKQIDLASSGFVYYVSVTGTTGVRQNFSDVVFEKLKSARSVIKNKLLVGFGISTPEDVKRFTPYCDGVIVGSAIINIINRGGDILKVTEFVTAMKQACR